MATRQCLGMDMLMPLNHTCSLVDEWGDGRGAVISAMWPWSKQQVRVTVRSVGRPVPIKEGVGLTEFICRFTSDGIATLLAEVHVREQICFESHA